MAIIIDDKNTWGDIQRLLWYIFTITAFFCLGSLSRLYFDGEQEPVSCNCSCAVTYTGTVNEVKAYFIQRIPATGIK